ncbi:MAG TPA: hypothetical protein VGP72_10690 [Planctomycetota bacterium]
MGLKLRVNTFFQVNAEDVYSAYLQFYGPGAVLEDFPCGEQDQYVLRQRRQDWTILEWDGGWEWLVRRQAELHVSNLLKCRGFLLFVFDGDYWGYEYFSSGTILDHFVQVEKPCDGADWFPGQNTSGKPDLIAGEFPWLSKADIANYFVRNPIDDIAEPNPGESQIEYDRRIWAEHQRLNVPARDGDEFKRFDECAILDFMRLLGIPVELRGKRVTFIAPEYKRFFVGPEVHAGGPARRAGCER